MKNQYKLQFILRTEALAYNPHKKKCEIQTYFDFERKISDCLWIREKKHMRKAKEISLIY